MSKNILYPLLFAIWLSACTSKNDQTLSTELEEAHVEQGQLIENDDVAFLLGKQLEEFVKLQDFESFSDELTENMHAYPPSQDTIRSFTINGMQFKKYLYNDGNENLIFAQIPSGSKGIPNLLKIGISKAELSHALALHFINDTITISNQDHTYLFFLYFNNMKLSGVTFEAYTD